jgi:hypothetical protein
VVVELRRAPPSGRMDALLPNVTEFKDKRCTTGPNLIAPRQLGLLEILDFNVIYAEPGLRRILHQGLFQVHVYFLRP